MKKAFYRLPVSASQVGIFLLLPLLLVACQKDEYKDESFNCSVVIKKGEEGQIISKWKLVSGQTVFFNPRKEDFSCQEVIYHFRVDGTLLISSDTQQLIGHEAGEYTYELFELKTGEEENYSLKIGNNNTGCSIGEEHMILDNSMLDGPILHLVRIE